MIIATRAWWIATTKLSSNGISLMVKHNISGISSIFTTAICKIAYFPASQRTRTSLVFKKDRKGNRLNQHWSICGASQQGKICIFSCGSSTILPAHHSYLRCTVLWILTVMYTLQSTITKTTFESLPLFHFIFSTYCQWAHNQLLTFLLCSGFHCSCALPRSWRAIIISDNTWWLFEKGCICMFACAVYSLYFKCIFTVRPPCQEGQVYCWSACSLRWYPAIGRGFN